MIRWRVAGPFVAVIALPWLLLAAVLMAWAWAQ